MEKEVRSLSGIPLGADAVNCDLQSQELMSMVMGDWRGTYCLTRNDPQLLALLFAGTERR